MSLVHFSPRRLAHINLYVSDLDCSLAFYERVCGIERVRMESAINAGFLSNGNTHHDVGLIQVSAGEDRIGRDGKVQISATRGTRPGLNHLGWEMENEAELIAAYQRMLANGLKPTALYDHIISHAIYVADPDGNVHEFYADTLRDWRSVFNLEHDDLVTSQWDPLVATPSEARNYIDNPPLRRVDDAALHARHIAGAVFATHNFEAMSEFMTEVAGLTCVAERSGAQRQASFAGTRGNGDLTLVEVPAGQPTGLERFRLLIESQENLQEVSGALGSTVTVAGRVSESNGEAVLLRDPDGFTVELFSPATAGQLAVAA